MSMEDILRNMYGGNMPSCVGVGFNTGRTFDDGGGLASTGSGSENIDERGMTLEDYLATAGELVEKDAPSANPIATDQSEQQPLTINNVVLGFGSRMGVDALGEGRGGRGRRRPILDTADRAQMQRQKRMIKNRESAARSRERKQAYTAELESLAGNLELENTDIRTYLENSKEKRVTKLKAPMRFPIILKKKPQVKLRKCGSMEW
ncbi:hypothetical protein HPP92_024802 [Vanilla planifolia]|uniref:BZIP domain-containing protein n=1 Tax=Vanilla planifolia TaxID=51239 RepID=A0A835PLG1_VANPL|nr:hypothetical protein HPP92_024802 [Vanilla planifolia]